MKCPKCGSEGNIRIVCLNTNCLSVMTEEEYNISMRRSVHHQARLDKVLSKFEKLVILNASFSYRKGKFYMQSAYLDQRKIEISLETAEHLIADLERECNFD